MPRCTCSTHPFDLSAAYAICSMSDLLPTILRAMGITIDSTMDGKPWGLG
ncbi:MAG: hypothetical protein ACXWZF_11315 [Actinomycetota bacterium]